MPTRMPILAMLRLSPAIAQASPETTAPGPLGTIACVMINLVGIADLRGDAPRPDARRNLGAKPVIRRRTIRPQWLPATLLWSLAWMPVTATADSCRLTNPGEVEVVRDLIRPDTTIVRYCWYCDDAEPLPLRVRDIGFEHIEPARVRITAWANEPSEHQFPLEALEQAEADGTGPLARFIREDIEQQYSDTTGYLGPDDPYLVEEKNARFHMLLDFAREDHERRTWDELRINDEPADPRLLYVPVGDNRYRSVGRQLDCGMGAAPTTVTFQPVERDPDKAEPPQPFVADVIGQCYDGACPLDTWTVARETPLLRTTDANVEVIAVLEPGDTVVPLQTLVHVTASRLEPTEDHNRFLAGDSVYLLDSRGEGFHRFWHYGDVFVLDATGIDFSARQDYCERGNECWATAQEYPDSVWWSRVRRSDGVEGWVRDPIRVLDGVLTSH